MTKSNQLWALIILFLIVSIAISGLVIWAKYPSGQPVEITLPPRQEEPESEIYIGGAVKNPGFYPLRTGDTIRDIIQAAGGATAKADYRGLKLYLPSLGEAEPPQKVDLNRAEAWLLQALPGIGESRAQAIIKYRQQKGRFHNISEVTNVAGISTATYEKIKHLITVAE